MIRCAEDKNNSNLNRALMGSLNIWINNHSLKELPLTGRRFTWSNQRDVPTLVKLDRVFCTSDWEALFLDCSLQSNASSMSDHCPLVLRLNVGFKGKKRFHFESFWPKMQGFQEVVSDS